MMGLDILGAGALVILAAGPGMGACQMPKAAQINVSPTTKPVVYDNRRSLDELQAVTVDTINPYDYHGITRTQGFMEGTIKMIPSIKMGYEFRPENQTFCLWYDTIDVKFEIEPRIVIAREVYEDSCLRQAVGDHEMKHVNADRRIVNKYADIIGRKIYQALEQRGFMAGPVPRERGQEVADRMQQTVYQVIEHEYKKMQLERTDVQRDIDSLEEYERVDALCAKSADIPLRPAYIKRR